MINYNHKIAFENRDMDFYGLAKKFQIESLNTPSMPSDCGTVKSFLGFFDNCSRIVDYGEACNQSQMFWG